MDATQTLQEIREILLASKRLINTSSDNDFVYMEKLEKFHMKLCSDISALDSWIEFGGNLPSDWRPENKG